ncbi:MAG: PEP-utilizing enzyme [Syntrophorhabdales bacterium]|jgi:phosphohistidine swiveling domain-containing protein
MESIDRVKTAVPFEFNAGIDLEAHEAWFVDHLHTLESPDYFLTTYDEANTQGMIWGAEKLPLPGSKGSEWRNINYVKILICPIVVTSEAEVAERQERLTENLLSLIDGYDKIWGDLKAELLELYRPFKEFDVNSASSLELARRLVPLRAAVFRMSEVHFYVMYVAFSMFMIFEDLCREVLGIDATHQDFQAMVSGFDNKSFECERGLWGLSRKVLELDLAQTFDAPSADIAPKLREMENGRQWLDELGRFIDEFGWRNERLWTISAPSWRDDPRYVIDRVKVYLKANPPGERLQALIRKREEKIAEYMPKVPEDRKGIFTLLLKGAQNASSFGEEHDLYCEMQTDALVRMYYLALGKRFVEAGTLNDVSDIFFLTYGEARMIGLYPKKYRLQSVIAERRERGKKDPKIVLPNTNVLSNSMNEGEAFQWMMGSREPIFMKVIVGELPKPRPELKADLIGVAGASGVAEGPARIISSVEQLNEVRPGEILVALTTSITWTPIFSLLKGAVLDRGGTLSHAAVICREYGIPCVLNTFEATKKIRNGQKIRVDGNEGAVYIVD